MSESLGLESGRQDLITLADGSMLTTHGPAVCSGDACCVHRPSDHPLNLAPLVWSQEMRLMFRVCPHDAIHPDPDGMEHYSKLALLGREPWYDGWHPCCPQRCCEP